MMNTQISVADKERQRKASKKKEYKTNLLFHTSMSSSWAFSKHQQNKVQSNEVYLAVP